MTVFDLPNFNIDFVKSNQVSHSLLSDVNNRRKQIEAQTSFILSILEEIRPDTIVEIGTHTAHFCYLLSLWKKDIIIDTFDVREKYRRFVTNVKYVTGNNNIFFHLEPMEKVIYHNVDLIWIDGSHKYKDVIKDAITARNHNIPNILFDDARHVEDVGKAIKEFLNEYKDYKYVSQSEAEDDRGIVYVKKI